MSIVISCSDMFEVAVFNLFDVFAMLECDFS